MSDLEITKACAEAMGIELMPHSNLIERGGDLPAILAYNPLKDDAQAMALVKKFQMEVSYGRDGCEDITCCAKLEYVPFVAVKTIRVFNKDLNRAICECVAKLQAVEAQQPVTR